MNKDNGHFTSRLWGQVMCSCEATRRGGSKVCVELTCRGGPVSDVGGDGALGVIEVGQLIPEPILR